MNLIVRDRINKLRESDDPSDHDRATTFEMLCILEEGQTDIKVELTAVKVQTTMHNGRMVKIEDVNRLHVSRIEALEKPAVELRVIVKALGKAASVVVLIVGLATGIKALTSKPQPSKVETKEPPQEVQPVTQKKTLSPK